MSLLSVSLLPTTWASFVAQMVKNLPTVQETWVPSLSWKDPLEKGMATPLQYSCLENAMGRGGLQFLGPKESDTTERPSLSLHLPATQIVAHKTVLCGSQLPPSQRDIFLSSQRGVCMSSEQHGSVTLLGRD